jgi:hypothetical protein
VADATGHRKCVTESGYGGADVVVFGAEFEVIIVFFRPQQERKNTFIKEIKCN